MFACLGERRFFCLFLAGFLSFLLLAVLPFPLPLCLKPALDLLPFGFKEVLVTRHIENRIESTVDSGRALAHGLAELEDIVLDFVLMSRRDGRRRQSLEYFRDQTADRLQPFKAILDARAPGFDFHLPFQDRGHPYVILMPVGERGICGGSGWLDDGFGWHQRGRRSLSLLWRSRPTIEDINGFPLVLNDSPATRIIFVHSPCIDGSKPVGDGAQDQRRHPLRPAWGFHPRKDEVFRHSLAALNALHLGIGVDV